MAGLGFTLSYSISGLFAGQLVDKYNRKYLLGFGCLLWSCTTFIQGSTNSFAIFFAMRFLLGILQSIGMPATITLISDYFPPERRTTATSIQNGGMYLGSALSSFSILAIKNFGWRYTFKGMALFGISIGALMLLFMREPRNVNQTKTDQIPCEANFDIEYESEKPKENKLETLRNSLLDVMKNPVSRNVTIAGMFNYAGGYAMMYFMPAFFQKVYPFHKAEFASINALSLSILGFISTLAGGIISDRYNKKNPKIMSQVCAIGSLMAFPVSMLCFLCTQNFYLSISCLSLKYLLGETWVPPALSMIQNTFGKKKSGRMVSAFLFYCTVAGTASTAICGFLSHYFNTAANPMVLGKILAFVSAIQYVGSIPFFIKSG